jgi:hypothetical protein
LSGGNHIEIGKVEKSNWQSFEYAALELQEGIKAQFKRKQGK